MICPRCKAKMRMEKYYTPSGAWWGWSCLMCGNVIDLEILKNRKDHSPKFQRVKERRNTILWKA